MSAREERSIARDYTMARIAACRSNLSAALAACDGLLAHFVDPEEDKRGKERKELLEGIDALIGEAANAVQLAQESWSDVDPTEGEPEVDDDDDDEDEEDEEEDDEEDEED